MASRLIPDKHFRMTCRPGQGAETCRYITCTLSGIECARLTETGPLLKRMSDEGRMQARGENCPGIGEDGSVAGGSHG